jgi:hypothetical protein
MSRCAARTAVNAPFNANANVPARSKTSSTDASDIARVYRIRTADPSQTVIVGPVSSTSVVNRPSFGGGIDPRKGGVMSAPKKYPPEVRDRAIRLVDDLLADEQLQLSVTGACRRVGEQLGINRDTLRG